MAIPSCSPENAVAEACDPVEGGRAPNDHKRILDGGRKPSDYNCLATGILSRDSQYAEPGVDQRA